MCFLATTRQQSCACFCLFTGGGGGPHVTSACDARYIKCVSRKNMNHLNAVTRLMIIIILLVDFGLLLLCLVNCSHSTIIRFTATVLHMLHCVFIFPDVFVDVVLFPSLSTSSRIQFTNAPTAMSHLESIENCKW